MSKVQRVKSILGSIFYLPELIVGLLAGAWTALSLTAKNFVPMLPGLCRAIGQFALASFKALITTAAVFAVVNFVFGGAPLYPIVVLNTLANGTFHTLPLLVQHGFAFIFAASMANFKWNLTYNDAREGHVSFVSGLLRFWAPAVILGLEIVKHVGFSLGILTNNHERNPQDVYNAAKEQAESAANSIYVGAVQGAAYVTQFKSYVSSSVGNSYIAQRLYGRDAESVPTHSAHVSCNPT